MNPNLKQFIDIIVKLIIRAAWSATERRNGVYALELSSKIISKPKTKKTTNLSTDLWFVLPLLNLESTELRWFKPQRQII